MARILFGAGANLASHTRALCVPESCVPRRAHAHNTHPMSYGAMHALRAGGSAGRAEAQQLITDMTQQHDVTVFSKSTCPFCTRVKGMLDEYKLDDVAVVELNEREDGGDIQDTLLEMTGQRTVPNVFIGGKHIGGCDDTMKLHNDGELETLLKSAKGSRSGDPKMMAGYATYPGGALNVRRAGTTLNRRTCNGSAAVSSESHSWILEA